MKTRIISALIAIALLISSTVIWKAQGLMVLGSLVILIGIYEYGRLTLGHSQSPLHIRVAFSVLAAALYFATVANEQIALFLIAAAVVLFLTMVLMLVRKSTDLQIAFYLQSAGVTGFLYCGVFPGLAIRTLGLENGLAWFFALLAIVFSGDTFAYLTGRAFGKQKLLEAVSPKKTVEGSIGGLFGSSLAGALMCFFFLDGVPLPLMIVLSVTTGLFAQVGDLIESQIKRLAEVKDSGHIMPGHGGVLDRLDGVIFAAPIFYLFARLLA